MDTVLCRTSKLYEFCAVRFLQGEQPVYLAALHIPEFLEVLQIDWIDLPPEERAQRIPSKSRVNKAAAYVLENPSGWKFPTVTASIDGDVTFEDAPKMGNPVLAAGLLQIATGTRILLNDGGHRRGALDKAFSHNPRQLEDEGIGVMFVVDPGLRRAQNLFAVLNLTSAKPPKSLGLLYTWSLD